MAIDTNNKKLALMNLRLPFFPSVPLSPGALGQDDNQQLLHEYPGILWETPGAGITQLVNFGLVEALLIDGGLVA